ncbi:Homeobox-leucine zipper protein HOX10 [Triticum urartu]|uniref:Homeobox-leucine zipper protein HOX10 n=1 Tax=Triticum urartu TaxID=4572 RepID=M7ZSI6_TRIUA|nr:Homeobox-leucine zipper protein HOX10 [Triticum urartu]
MAMRGGSSDGGGSDRGAGMDSGKYVRYTPEQVETLERVYADCPKPTSSRRQQLLRECPILANIEARQIKVWFQNRRCRDKLRKESSRLESVNRKVSAMNKLLMEENERLQKQVSQLVHENAQVRQQLQNTSMANDASCESNVTAPQNPIRDASNPSGLLSIAEETLTEFLSKATGTAIEWVQMPGMKPGPDSVGIVAISHGCRGVAARACGLVNLEPTKVVEILKDRPSWFRDCRSLEVFTVLPGANGGTIELVYTQLYAPTTLVPARDFWTLRYTTIVEDGSLVVCERSLSGSGGGPSAASAQQFVRAEMLPSGYLVRPCDGGGSIVHIVDHLEFEAWNIPEVLRPLYESSRVVAQKMTTAALRHIRQIAQETSGEVVYALGRQPAVLRTFSQRLSRGFNDAISGFNDDGWSIMAGDGIEDVVVACNSTKKIRSISNGVNAFEAPGGTICAKASMLLQSVPPAILVRFLREHRSEWADYSMDAYLASALKTSTCSFPGLRPMRFSGSQIIMPLAHTVENEEILEVVRLEGQPLSHDEVLLSRDIDMLQDVVSSGRTLDLASSLEVGSTAAQASGASPDDCSVRSVLTIAFQFPYELHLQDSVAAMARQYVRSIVSAVQRVSIAISPSQSGLNAGQRILSGLPEAATLARWICQSYHYHLGVELLTQSDVAGEALLKMLWHYQDAILCCSFKFWGTYSVAGWCIDGPACCSCYMSFSSYTEVPVFTFANKAGLDMLETSLVALQDLTLDKIFDEPGRKALFSEISKLVEEGHVYLPSGVCMSGMGRHVSFDQAVAWKVLGEDSSVHCLALCFVNWSFV